MGKLGFCLGANLNSFLLGVTWFQEDKLFAVHLGPFLLAFQWGEENDD